MMCVLIIQKIDSKIFLLFEIKYANPFFQNKAIKVKGQNTVDAIIENKCELISNF